MSKARKRQSGLKSKNPNVGSKFSKTNSEPNAYESMLYSYENTKEQIEGLRSVQDLFLARQENKEKAYKVTYKDTPDILFIEFTSNKDRAKGNVTKFLKENLHPRFVDREWRERYRSCRAVRIPEFDKYKAEKKVPILELMKLGVSFPCSVCGQDMFTLDDFEIGRCFIVEDEGDLNFFTKGYVLCYNCYKKYIS